MNSLVVSNDKGTVNKHNAKANSIISNNKKTTISSNLHLGGENADCSKEDPAEKYGKSRSTLSSMTMAVFLGAWKGGKDFLWAQLQVAVVLTVAYIGNKWPHSYQRNENHNPSMFWVMCGALLVAAAFTWNHEAKVSARGVQLLSRAQTEEWKGWMQWAFIMYHYYRMYAAYNEIRVFVSAYVWMTGFGNFLYFEKTKDFSLERAISMWIRINYFPLLLSTFLNVPLELYYVVPLHTAGFFIAMATCYASSILQQKTVMGWSAHKANAVAIAACLVVHVLFYETPAVNLLQLFSKEYLFRFQSDKYSAWVGMLSGFGWFKFKEYMQWCYGDANSQDSNPQNGSVAHGESTSHEVTSNGTQAPLALPIKITLEQQKLAAMWGQRVMGVFLIFLWYALFGHINDKYVYNPVHPYIFWMPVAGWLMLRNSSKYLTDAHAGAMEFFGRITLETYVLQFHVFMCNQVQHIPVVIPGSGPDGNPTLKACNMLFCGAFFVALAHWARQITVTTQTTVTELAGLLLKGPPPPNVEASTADADKALDQNGGAAATTPTSRENGETKESV